MAIEAYAPEIQPADLNIFPLNLDEEHGPALHLVRDPDVFPAEQTESYERRQGIRKVNLNRRGVMLLDLDDKKVLARVLNRPQREALSAMEFKPKPELHITILNYGNGQRLIQAFNGDRNKLAKVEAEANDVDWSWYPTGRFFPFQGRRKGAIKIVTLVDCPGAEEFYSRLEDGLLGLRLERHPMHITLMKKPGELLNHSNAIIGGVAIGKPLYTLDRLKEDYETEDDREIIAVG